MATISQVNINDLSYDFIDVKSRNILTEFYDVDKIVLDGGEYSAITNPAINIYNSSLGNASTANGASERLIEIVDWTGEARSWIAEESFATGQKQQGILCRTSRKKLTDGSITAYENSIRLSLDPDCNPFVAIAGQPWRRALGFGDDISTDTISDIITPGSGIIITHASYRERFNVAMLYLHFKYNQAISVPNHGDIANITIGTLVAGKRPSVHPEAFSNGSEGGAAWYDINPGTGVITLCAIEAMSSTTRTIAANTQFNLASTYLVR